VYAFVIMPNHIHLVWQMMEMNNNEMPHTSFLKFTAHAFKKELLMRDPKALELYTVDARNKSYEFWQRDSLAFELIMQKTINQKIEYIHFNPTMQRWNLCKEPAEYPYSSAGFYETGIAKFKFLKHIANAL
jgi:putative transposase